MKKITKFFAAFFILINLDLKASTTYIEFVGSEFEGFTTPSGGSFVDSLHHLMEKTGHYSPNIKILKQDKLYAQLATNKVQCLMGGSLSLLKFYGIDTKKYIESQSFWPIKYVFYTSKNKETISNFKDLDKKKIGIYFSELKTVTNYLPKNVNIVTFKTKRQLFQALRDTKIDTAIDAYPLLPKYYNDVNYDSNFLLIEFNTSIVCEKNDVNEKFIGEINNLLNSNSVKEEIKRIYMRYY